MLPGATGLAITEGGVRADGTCYYRVQWPLAGESVPTTKGRGSAMGWRWNCCYLRRPAAVGEKREKREKLGGGGREG